jgi:hypothetical protein
MNVSFTFWKRLLFFIFFICIYAFIGMYKTFPLRPQSVHQWAQCDRAAVAKLYGSITLDITEPQTFNIENGSGITGMEFPLVNYLVGILYRIFGFHEFIYRLVILIILLTGLFAAFEFSNWFSGNHYKSFLITSVFSLSPVLAFYTPNFLPDTVSLSFILIAWYYFLKFIQKNKIIYLILLIIFSLAGSLIKISSLISIIVMILLVLLNYKINFKEFQNVSRKNQRIIIASLLVVVAIVFSWYYYANWLSKVNDSNVFLLRAKTTFVPNEIWDHIIFVKNLWWQQYYPKLLYYFILISSVFLLIYKKQANKMLTAITVLLWLGTLLFAFLMLSQFRDHDYYIITLLPVVFFQLLLFSETFIKVISPKTNKATIILNILLFALAINGILTCRSNFNFRYSEGSWMDSFSLYDSYFNLDDKLNSVGIKEHDVVISIVDDSPNISLYLMNRRGITISPQEDNNTIGNKINSFKSDNCYIILNDRSYLQRGIIEIETKPILAEINGLIIIKND